MQETIKQAVEFEIKIKLAEKDLELQKAVRGNETLVEKVKMLYEIINDYKAFIDALKSSGKKPEKTEEKK